MLTDGSHDIPAGKVAAVVTHLEMREEVTTRPASMPEEATLQSVKQPEPDWYRDLFMRVGGLDWLWFSRLELDDAALGAILHDPDVELYALMQDGIAQGMVELDFRQSDECELAFFGLTSKLIGQGAGRYMMNHAIARAWSRPISRFHVHTCTLDSPQALGFYQGSGFVARRQQVEIADDPRLTGVVPRDAGTHVPLFPTD
ncbi:GNAT family N-acetyltransferase [Sedimentitalea todarodis]|uniref:GNAT family N-acetyltransferase n=1 Tax=Sedimentitalea todarodis TaxID=1631240 RepID=A0ABU3VA84_9RHOB|nr:GNAT family N-acetyltransferase [Sedimentitalea todarodis]MDU9003079.1 GNAT family N-acetyltransferase [Sedimentitalea todarodis]